VATNMLAFAVATLLTHGHSYWQWVLVYAGAIIVQLLMLHFVLHQRWARLLMYREYEDADVVARANRI
jgi:hypothetical protein